MSSPFHPHESGDSHDAIRTTEASEAEPEQKSETRVAACWVMICSRMIPQGNLIYNYHILGDPIGIYVI